MKTVLLIGTASQGMITFRKPLIQALQAEGCRVAALAFDDEYREEIEALGVDFYPVNDGNRSINPLKILRLKSKYKKLIQDIAPDVVFTFQLKPNTFGVLAAKSAGITHIYSMVEGAGDVFNNTGIKWRVIRAVVSYLYRHALVHSKRVFFLNNDNANEFIKRRLVKRENAERIHGIGVDLSHFVPTPFEEQPAFLMVARMLKTKGVYEYCECARRVRQAHPEAVFYYLGAEGTVTLDDIQGYIDDGSVTYLGTTKDVRPHLQACLMLLLPSYHEGMPMSVMEAQSAGRAVITSDSVGCRDTVVDGYNGFLVSLTDIGAMAERCIWAIENREAAMEMGRNARLYAEEHFDAVKINQRLLEVILEGEVASPVTVE